MAAVAEVFEVASSCIVEERFDGRVELRLVALDGDDGVAAALDDFAGDVLLAAGRVDGDEGVLQLDLRQQSGIAVISLDLSSAATWPKAMPSSLAQALTTCIGPRPFAASCEPRQVLPSMATRRAWRPPSGVDGVGDPFPEALLEGVGLQGDEQAADAVAGGDAVGQFEEPREPARAGWRPSGGWRWGRRTRRRGGDADDGDVGEEVLAVAGVAGVGERFEVRGDGPDVHQRGGHARRPGVRIAVSPGDPRSRHGRALHSSWCINTGLLAQAHPFLPAIRAGRDLRI